VLDIARQLDGQAPSVGQRGADLRPGCRLLEADRQRRLEVRPAGRCARAGASAATKGMAEQFAEDVAAAEGAATGAEFEMRARARLAESGEGIGAGALEAAEALPALGVDLAAVEGAALLLVSEDLVGLGDLRELPLGIRVGPVLVRMVALGQFPVSRLDLLLGRVAGDTQHRIWVTHHVVPGIAIRILHAICVLKRRVSSLCRPDSIRRPCRGS